MKMKRKSSPPAVTHDQFATEPFPTYFKRGAQSDSFGTVLAPGVKSERTRGRYSMPRDARTEHAIYLTDEEKFTPRSSAAPGRKGSSLKRSSPEPRIRSGQD